MEKAAEIVDTWLRHQHEDVIDKLAKQPQMQLQYIQRVLADKAQEIERKLSVSTTCVGVMKEQAVTGNSSEEYKRYNKILQQHIELLCDYAPKQVMLALKKKYYPLDACVSICTKKKHMAALAFLLKRSGDFSGSLEKYLELIQRAGNDMLNATAKVAMDESMAELEDHFQYAAKVCKKNAAVSGNDESGQEMWFTLLDYLYQSMLTFMDKKTKAEEAKTSTANLDRAIDCVNRCIQKLLNDMMNFVSFPTILTRVTEKHGELELENFKKMFMNMLFSYVYQEKILQTASNIMANNIVKQFHSLTQFRSKGFPVLENICGKCGHSIPSTEAIEVTNYVCGHLFHSSCLHHSKSGCPICAAKALGIVLRGGANGRHVFT